MYVYAYYVCLMYLLRKFYVGMYVRIMYVCTYVYAYYVCLMYALCKFYVCMYVGMYVVLIM